MAEFPKELLNTIVKGDTVEVMKSLMPDESVGIIYTDPPYSIDKDYAADDGERDDGEFWLNDEFWKQLFRVLKDGGSLHMTVSTIRLPEWLDAARKAGFTYAHCSVYWNEQRVSGNWNGMWPFAWEPWLSFKKGSGFKLQKRLRSDVFKYLPDKETDHPCERNLGVWAYMLDHLPGDVVFDPFMGSGTTAVAATRLGRPFFGIERSAKYVSMGCERAANERSQLDLL